MNVKNHNVYSDKFILSVVDLNQIELATREDKQYEIDYWASLFKAKTWEELKMIAQNNEFMQEATETLYELNADNIIRQQCLARQDYYRTQNAYKKHQEELEKAYREISAEKEALLAEKVTLQSQISDKNQKILELQTQLEQYQN